MIQENVEVSVKLPRNLWDELRQQAKTEHEQETSLLIRAIEQYLYHTAAHISVVNDKNETRLQSSGRGEHKSAMGKYAHIGGSVAEFMAAKQDDIEHESRQR